MAYTVGSSESERGITGRILNRCVRTPVERAVARQFTPMVCVVYVNDSFSHALGGRQSHRWDRRCRGRVAARRSSCNDRRVIDQLINSPITGRTNRRINHQVREPADVLGRVESGRRALTVRKSHWAWFIRKNIDVDSELDKALHTSFRSSSEKTLEEGTLLNYDVAAHLES